MDQILFWLSGFGALVARDPILQWLCGYGAVGAVVAALFLFIGFGRVDEASHGAWTVRPVLFPGMMILWPVVLVRWIMLERQRGARP